MPRPFKNRRVSGQYEVNYFKPPGVPLRFLQEVCLGVDEVEALRMADFEEMYQAQAAEKMGVSRQTFGNIIKSAHKKIADALINGKAIRIEGGPVNFDIERRYTMPCGDGTGPMGMEPGNGCGQGMGRGRGRGRMGSPFNAGPAGECICPSCGRTAPHIKGRPYSESNCPQCGARMSRKR